MFIPDYNVFNELKPCPFCGQKPVAHDKNDALFIECRVCDIVFCGLNAIESWQTRKYQENPFNFLYDFKNWFAFEVAIRNNET